MARRKNTEDSQAKKRMFISVGEFLKHERQVAGRTQQHFATAMGLTSVQYISNVERGISPASPEFLRTFRALTGINKIHMISVLKEHYGKYLNDELTPL